MDAHRRSSRPPDERRTAIRRLLATATVAAVAGLSAQPIATAARTPDAASYVVDLTTGERARVWTGTESVTFTNTGTTDLGEAWFRLWANGPSRCREPGIEVSNVTGGTAGSLAVRCSALPVTLDAPLAPGASTTIGMDIRILVPRANDRFGRVNGISMLGNALPLLAVNDEDGWNLEPYAPMGESFYSLVADFEVTLNVLPEIDTPTTGVLDPDAATPTPPPDGLAQRTYVATDVRDFMWVAAELRARRGTAAAGTQVNVWYRPRFFTREAADRALAAALRSMDAFSSAFGTYAYPEVDALFANFRAFAGMEYPQLVLSVPDRYVLAHELAHQWWYAIVGDDQFDEPWVDETFASWSMFYPFGEPSVGCRMFRWPSDTARLSNPMSYWMDHPDEYWVIYWQGACMLAKLADIFGLNRFVGILRDYAAGHWLDVATTADVRSAFEAAAVEDGIVLGDAFWDKWRVSLDTSARVIRGRGDPPPRPAGRLD